MNTLWAGGAAYVDAAGALAAVAAAVGTSKVAVVNGSDELVGITDDTLVETVVLDTAADGQAVGNVSGALGAISVSAGGGGATATDLVSMRHGTLYAGGLFADGFLEGMTTTFGGTQGADDQLGGYRERTIGAASGVSAAVGLNDTGTPYNNGEGIGWYPGLTVETGFQMTAGDVTGVGGANTGAGVGASSGNRVTNFDSTIASSFGVAWAPNKFGADAAYVCFYTWSGTGSPTTTRVNIGGSDIQPNTTWRWRVRCICNTVDASRRPTSVTIRLIDPADESTIYAEETFTTAGGDSMPLAADATTDRLGVYGFGHAQSLFGSTGSGTGTFRLFDTNTVANTDDSE